MTARTERVDELLRQEIGEILAREIADPRIGFVTVTDVETTPDLRHARVWVSVIGDAETRRASMAGLRDAMGYIQRELGRRLRMKRIPELHVRLDESAERATRVLEVLADLEAGQLPPEPPTGETLPTPVPRQAQPGDAPATSDTGSGGTTRPARRPGGARRRPSKPR